LFTVSASVGEDAKDLILPPVMAWVLEERIAVIIGRSQRNWRRGRGLGLGLGRR
jgi:hypothetical protein